MTIPEHLANRDIDPSTVVTAAELPSRARVVVVGGGIIGSSIAYHLTREGETDVVLVERGKLSSGTTWHAAGLVSQVRGTHALTALSRINAETYERLPAETGVETGMRRVGAVTVARTEARMQETLYGVSMARDVGVDVEVLEPSAVKDLWPSAVVDDLVGAVLFPADGTVNPGDATLAFVKGAVIAGLGTCRRPRSRACAPTSAAVSPDSTRPGARSRPRPSCSPADCGRASWRASPAPASPSIRRSTSG